MSSSLLQLGRRDPTPSNIFFDGWLFMLTMAGSYCAVLVVFLGTSSVYVGNYDGALNIIGNSQNMTTRNNEQTSLSFRSFIRTLVSRDT